MTTKHTRLNRRTRLTDSNIRAIRKSRKTLAELALKYNVHSTYISAIRNHRAPRRIVQDH